MLPDSCCTTHGEQHTVRKSSEEQRHNQRENALRTANFELFLVQLAILRGRHATTHSTAHVSGQAHQQEGQRTTTEQRQVTLFLSSSTKSARRVADFSDSCRVSFGASTAASLRAADQPGETENNRTQGNSEVSTCCSRCPP